MAGLGAAAVLHLQGLENDQVGYLLLWPMHLFGAEEVDLRQIAKSGRRALDNCAPVDIKAEGLVLVSNFDTSRIIAGRWTQRDGTVLATRLRAGYGNLRRDIESLGGWLHTIALRLVVGGPA